MYVYSIVVFRLQNIKLEDTLCPSPASKNLIERLPDSKLQIVVICPYFLQKVQATPASENMLFKIIHPDEILAMLLGVQDHIENDRLSSGEYPPPISIQWSRLGCCETIVMLLAKLTTTER